VRRLTFPREFPLTVQVVVLKGNFSLECILPSTPSVP
jgi:hypothetical protein